MRFVSVLTVRRVFALNTGSRIVRKLGGRIC